MGGGLLLMGGGLDSTAALLCLVTQRAQFEALFVRYGQRTERAEERSVRHFCNKYRIPLHVLEARFDRNPLAEKNPETWVVHGRNAAFACLALNVALSQELCRIIFAFHVEPVDAPFLDARPEFLPPLNRLLRYLSGDRVLAAAPYANLTRFELLRLGYERDPEIVTKTQTCYVNDEQEEGGCGRCRHCVLKAEMVAELSR